MNEWGMKGKASVLVDGQFGSTGKGLAAAWLSRFCGPGTIATCNAGANAGHTTRFKNGEGFVCFHLPTTGVMLENTRADGSSTCYINAGSIIDPESLEQEIKQTGLTRKRVIIHPRAAVITPDDRMRERMAGSATERTASTQKGVGAAISGKIMRSGVLAGNCRELDRYDVRSVNLNNHLVNGGPVVVEVPQGFDLSLNHGLAYPYTTSRDCWVGSGLSDAGIHPSFIGTVAMVVRTFPIRVGNIVTDQGKTVGTSGPFYQDSKELDWAEHFPGIEPERTTVTKRVRRIATWSNEQYKQALLYNRPSIVFLNFCNYLRNADEFLYQVRKMQAVEDDFINYEVRYVFGFGPCVEDVTDDIRTAQQWYEKRSF